MYEKIGIDLGAKTIKMAVVKETSGIFVLKHFKTYQVKENISEKEYFTYLKKCIADFAKISKLSFISLNFTIPCHSSIANLKYVKMPSLNKKILNKSLTYELEEEYDNINDKYYLWDIVKKDKEKEEADILLGFIGKRIVDSLSKLRKIKWRIERIELQPVSLGRIVKGNAIVIDFGHRTTKVYAYNEGSLFSVIDIPIAGERLNETIKSLYPSLDLEGIYEKKHNSFVWNEYLDLEGRSPEEISISKRLTEDIMSLSSEIKVNIRSLELQHNIYFDNIYYLGGTANLLYLIETVSRDLDFNIKHLNFLSVDNENSGYNILSKYILSGAVSINYKYLEELNFNKFAKGFIDFTAIATTALLMAIVVNVGSYKIHTRYDQTINDLTYLAKERDQIISAYNDQLSIINANINRNREVVDKLENITVLKSWLSDILYVLPEITPRTIGIEKMNIMNGHVVFNGYAKDYSSIGFFAMELEKLGRVNIDSIVDSVSSDIILDPSIEEDEESVDENKMSKTFQITLNHYNSIIERNLEIIDASNDVFDEIERELEEERTIIDYNSSEPNIIEDNNNNLITDKTIEEEVQGEVEQPSTGEDFIDGEYR